MKNYKIEKMVGNRISTMMKNILGVLTFLVMMGTSYTTQASHVVGGDLYYECLGKGFYRIVLEFRRDCFNGSVNAQFDDPVSIAIFDSEGQLQTGIGNQGQLFIDFDTDDTLNETLTSVCNVEGEDVCVQTTTYVDTLFLPDNDRGYVFAYQRCCRNSTLTNIAEPLETGATYWIAVTPQAIDECNSAARFGDFPSVYVCTNEDLVFDHSATDPDGDSLVYSLCLPSSGATRDEPLPQPASPPPYDVIEYIAPYSLGNVLGGDNPLQIDPVTGILTARPSIVGQFLVGVCVSEYRNGELISQTRRDFEYNVRVCKDPPQAMFSIEENPQCDGLTVEFNNESTGNATNQWFFDYPDMTNTSTDENPTYTYDMGGSYEVVLVVVDENGICTDTFSLDIGVADLNDPSVDFDINVLECNDEYQIQLVDNSTSSQPISSSEWIVSYLDVENTISEESPTISVPINADSLMVTRIVVSESGCSDTLSKSIPINDIDLTLVGDSVEICLGDTVALVMSSDPTLDYTWTPETGLHLGNPHSPLASPDETTTYIVSVTDGFCEITDTITVEVSREYDIQIIGDTIACEGFLTLEAVSEGGTEFEWFLDEEMTISLGTDNPIELPTLPMINTYYVKLLGDICESSSQITIQNEGFTIALQGPEPAIACAGQDVNFSVFTSKPDEEFAIEWSPSEALVSGQGESNASFNFDQPGSYNVTVSLSNSFGCTEIDTILMTIVSEPEVDLEDTIYVCNDMSVDLNPMADTSYFYNWSSEPDGLISDPNAVNPSVTVTETSTIFVTISVDDSGMCSLQDTIILIPAPDINLVGQQNDDILCPGDDKDLTALTDVDVTYLWTNEEEDTISTEMTVNVSPQTTSTYTITVTDEFGCTDSDQLTVVVSDLINLNLVSTDFVQCNSDPKTYTVSTDVDATVVWTDQEGNIIGMGLEISYGSTMDQTIIVTATDENGCEEVINFMIEVRPLEVNIIGEDVLCAGDSLFLALSEGNYTSISWTDEDGNVFSTEDGVIVSPEAETTYSVTVTNDSGCTASDSHTISVSDAINLTLLTENVDRCDSNPKTFTVSTDKEVNITWLDENGNQLGQGTEITISPNGTVEITVVAEDANGCSESITFVSSLYELNIELTGDDMICAGEEGTISVNNLNASDPLNYVWSPTDAINGDNTQSTITINPTEQTTYTVEIMNGAGCTWIQEFVVNVSQFGEDIFATADPSDISLGESTQLNTNEGDYTYSWEPSNSLDDSTISNPIATPDETTSYTVTVTNGDGCQQTAQVTVTVTPVECSDADIFVPNMFSPNGDNLNDHFEVNAVAIEEFQMVIYSRWGEKVFESNDQNFSWDGTFNGQNLEPDVYGYCVIIKCPGGGEFTKRGNVTILK